MLWTAFLLGLAGSLHCAGMCGPLAVAIGGSDRTSSSPLLRGLAYNFGRIFTYALMGIVFGLVGRSLALFGIQRWVSIAIGVGMLAGLITTHRFMTGVPMISIAGRLKSVLGRVLKNPSYGSSGLLGMVNGLLPCGLVYTAGAAAVASGTWLTGIQYMLLFGLGTFPLMLGLSAFGKSLPFAVRLRFQRVTPFLLAAVAVLLVLRGLELGIPYMSPALASGSVRCH